MNYVFTSWRNCWRVQFHFEDRANGIEFVSSLICVNLLSRRTCWWNWEAFLMLHRRYFNWARLKTSARNVLALENSNYSKNVATAIPIKGSSRLIFSSSSRSRPKDPRAILKKRSKSGRNCVCRLKWKIEKLTDVYQKYIQMSRIWTGIWKTSRHLAIKKLSNK